MSSLIEDLRDLAASVHSDVSVAEEAADEIERLREHIAEQQLDIVTLGQEVGRLREALTTYACRCGDGDCYKDEFVASCGRSARAALGEDG